jgi:hypothetical protein
VSTYDWLLFLHVTAAFMLVTAAVLFWAITLASRRGDHPFLSVAGVPALILIQAGSVFTLVFGVWLAIQQADYHPWDGWIVAAYLLWLIGVASGKRSGDAFQHAAKGGPDAPASRRRGVLLHAIVTAAVALILIDMIFKPGA